MHYHCEIVMPPNNNPLALVEKAWARFDENAKDPDYPLWDWWEVGGRFSGKKPNNVTTLEQTPKDMIVFAVLFITKDGEPREAFHCRLWNGATWQDTTFQGTMGHALELFSKKLESYKEDWREEMTPQPDWITVTVDYHV